MCAEGVGGKGEREQGGGGARVLELVGDAGEAVGPGAALALLKVACATMILGWVVGKSGAGFGPLAAG